MISVSVLFIHLSRNYCLYSEFVVASKTGTFRKWNNVPRRGISVEIKWILIIEKKSVSIDYLEKSRCFSAMWWEFSFQNICSILFKICYFDFEYFSNTLIRILNIMQCKFCRTLIKYTYILVFFHFTEDLWSISRKRKREKEEKLLK